jgi:uncharacterized protein YfaS (alpha-2-macroglobulin family)
MKRMGTFSLTISMIMLLFTIPSIVKAESSTEWKIWSSKTEVDIDKEWVITFSDEMDWRSLYGNISVVRERDKKEMPIDTYPINEDQSKVKVFLGDLYEFGETYYLYISKDVKSKNGTSLKEPIKMKFQTVYHEFNV